MTQIFHPSMNTFSKVTIFGGLFILVGLAFACDQIARSPYVTEVDVVREQPVPFTTSTTSAAWASIAAIVIRRSNSRRSPACPPLKFA